MNRAEKILGNTYHEYTTPIKLDQNKREWKRVALLAMREIAWEAWRDCMKQWAATIGRVQLEKEKKFFNDEWYGEQISLGEIALKPRKDRGDAFKQEYLEWELFLRKKNISTKDREEILRKMFNA